MEVGTTLIFSTFSHRSTMDEGALSAEWTGWASVAGRELCRDSLSAWSEWRGEQQPVSSLCS